MRLFITKKKIIKKLAEELAYLQIRADWWYYISDIKEKHDMSSNMLDAVSELKGVCTHLDVSLEKVYHEAYKIYDFRNSGKKDFEPDMELIKRLDKEFCEPMKKKRPFI